MMMSSAMQGYATFCLMINDIFFWFTKINDLMQSAFQQNREIDATAGGINDLLQCHVASKQ